MASDLSPQDILAWSRARREARLDPVTGDFRPRRYASVQEERQECRYDILIMDAMVSEYSRLILELVPDHPASEAERDHCWNRIVEAELLKKEYVERLAQLDAVIAKEAPARLG